MSTHKNRVRCTISNTPGGAGALTLSTADTGYRTLGAGDDGLSFDVVITDGTAWEVRTGCIYTHSGTSLARGTLEDSSTGSAITLTSAAVVTVTATAGWGNSVERLLKYGAARAKGNTTNQTLSSLSTFTRVTCLTQEFDEAGFWDDTNKIYKPTLAGRYLIAGQVSVSGIDSAKRMILRLGIDTAGGTSLSSSNAQSFDLFRGYSSVANGFVGGAGAAVVVADGTLSIGLLAWQDSSTSAVVDASANLCNFSAVYIGPVV